MNCPHCTEVTRDLEFCDHCNQEIGGAPPPRALGPLPLLGETELTKLIDEEAGGEVRRYEARSGGAAAVALEVSKRVYEERVSPAIEKLSTPAASLLPELVADQSSDPEGRVWLLARAATPRGTWARVAEDIAGSNAADETGRVAAILTHVAPVLRLCQRLHERGLVWLNFDPQELVEPRAAQGELVALNLVGNVFPAGSLPGRLMISPRYSAPEIAMFQAPTVGPASDIFHVGVLVTYLVAGIFPRGISGRGLEALHYRLPAARTFRVGLPPGIDPVLRRATDPDPTQRFRSMTDFARALDAARGEATKRAASTGLVCSWYGVTDVGTVKKTLCPVNQDAVYPEHEKRSTMLGDLDNEPYGLLAVADGVSNCRLGSGDAAARLAIEAVAEAHDRISACASDLVDPSGAAGDPVRPTVRDLLAEIPLRATEKILRSLPEEPADPGGVMTSTLVAAWIDRGRATVMNVGDSRAYLITAEYHEQLTRDDDVETDEIALGAPPEDVAEIAELERKALRRIVGALRRREAGGVEPDRARLEPGFVTFGLLPGDTLLLCSDGLIEEGMFLGAAEAVALVREGASDPVETVARRLVDAANARQRPPRNGDNVSCILVRVVGPGAESASHG